MPKKIIDRVIDFYDKNIPRTYDPMINWVFDAKLTSTKL